MTEITASVGHLHLEPMLEGKARSLRAVAAADRGKAAVGRTHRELLGAIVQMERTEGWRV